MKYKDTDVAIVGMSALFAGAGSLAQYWQNIVSGKCSIEEAPDSWSYPYYDPDSEDSTRIYTRKGGFIGDFTDFNPAEFGIMPNAIDGSDPDGFLLLRLARDALADAGYLDRDFDRSKAGIIMGRGNYLNRGQTGVMQHGLVLDQTVQLIQKIFPDLSNEKLTEVRDSLKRSLPPFGPETIPGIVPNLVTGRVANRLNLMGPNYLVDAACASTLIAIEQGIRELHSGRCDLVLSGGVHAASPPALSMVFCQIGALSRGDLTPFGATASGTLLGEGIGIVVLKRHADALRDGDRVYAVVKGLGIASDGRAKGLLAPRLEGEVLAIERGYSNSGIDPATIGLIEAHGTGIPLGDQTELAALTQVFGGRQDSLPECAIGSVKSMIGHCLPAAGAAGVIKTALALYHKVLPMTLCDQPSPELPFETSRFYVNNATRPWIHGSRDIPRRAAVDSFGFGGINAHVILEEAAETDAPAPLQWPSEVVVICGDTRDALLANIDNILEVLGSADAPRLCDLAYTLACLEPARERLVVVTTSTDELATKLSRARQALENPGRHQMQSRNGLFFDDAPQARGQTAFLFPGEGAQYTNMLADLCLAFPSVRRWFDRLDETFADEDTPPSSLIFPAPTGLTPEQRQEVENRLFEMDIGSEVVSISNLALTELLRELGVPCDVMLGHSTGEFAALVASGIFQVLDDPDVVMQNMRELHDRHQDMVRDGSITSGTLLAVGALDHEQIRQEVAEAGEDVFLAMDNCRNQAVLFAPIDKADALKSRLKSHGAVVLSLPFDRAYHTPLFESVAGSVREFFDKVDVQAARTPLYSCSTMEVFPDDATGIRDTAAKQFSTRVRFRETVLKMSDRGVSTFIEVGPRDNLTSFVKDILHDKEHVAIASNVQRVPALRQIQYLLAELFVRGTIDDLSSLFSGRGCDKLDVSLTRKAENKGMRLNIDMPIMSLNEPSLLEQLKPRTPSAKEESRVVELHPAPPVPVSPSAPPSTSGLALVPEPAPVNPVVSTPASAEPVVTPASMNPRLAILQGHFELMNEFMAQQARTMQSITGGVVASASPREPAELTFSDRYPLLGEIVSHQPERLIAVRSYTLGQDLYLGDHTIGVGVPISVLQPDKLALPVVPLTFSMEAIAEAAHCLTGGQGRISSLHDIAGLRWIALERGRAVHLRITAEMESSHAGISVVRVQIDEVEDPGDTSGKFTFEGRVEVATDYSSASAPMEFSGTPLSASSTADADLYRGAMFHGPRLRGVRHIRGLSNDRIEADMVTLAREDLFSFTRVPQFQMDPALLDACGQLLGFWSFENVHPAANLFPVQIKRLQLFAPPPPPGTALIGRAKVRREQGDQMLEANIEVADRQGQPLLQLSGWCDRVFQDNTAQHFLDWLLNPPGSYLSEPRLENESAVIARGMTPARGACLIGAGGIWMKAAAHMVLTSAEREIWYSLPEYGSSREEWLLRHITAKDAARQWALEKHSLALAPIDLEIRTGAEGKPYLHSDFAGGITFPALSMMHNKGHSAACIAHEPDGLGDTDLERLASEVIEQQSRSALSA